MKVPSVALISTYVPRLCGIAHFTHNLATAVCDTSGHHLGENPKVQILALHNPSDGFRYGPEVTFVIRHSQRRDYIEAAQYLNLSSVDLVCLQHEYGIFGGEDGKYVLDLLESLNKPVVTTLHTVLAEPSESQKKILQTLCEASGTLVVISEMARDILKRVYGVHGERILHIHHGVHEVPFLDSGFYKDQFQLEGKKVLLTFGFLGPDKGIEHAIDAVSLLVEEFPDLVYIVLGSTHPDLKKQSGEGYRMALQQRAQDRGIKEHVIFLDRFLPRQQLLEFLLTADIYVAPLLNQDQISSGTLAYAMGCGKAIVSTPTWYAEELLAEGRGLLTPFADSKEMADRIRRLLLNEVERNQIRKRAYQFSQRMVWKKAARSYMDCFKSTAERGLLRHPLYQILTPLPEMRLDHLRRMTDDTGLLQDAIYATPRRSHGYTTDENARALSLVIHHRAFFQDDSVLPLAETYLSFLCHAFEEEPARFHNQMGFDRRWLDRLGSEDCQGRALAALAEFLLLAPNDASAAIAQDLFARALPPLKTFTSPRAWAWVVEACDTYLKRFGGAKDVREIREEMAFRLLGAFEANASPDWPWCEDELTYDNARLCQALIVAGVVTDHGEKIRYGLASLEWLLKIQTCPETGRLSLIGSLGWMRRGEEKAQFDQRPSDAAGLLAACHVAYNATKDKKWLTEMRKCFNWFMGSNDLNVPLYDFQTHGCRDGLQANGANHNQGAEALTAYLSALLRMNEAGAA